MKCHCRWLKKATRIKVGREFSSCRPVHRHRSTLSAKHNPGASRSWNTPTSVCDHTDASIGIHLGTGVLSLEKYGTCQLGEVYFWLETYQPQDHIRDACSFSESPPPSQPPTPHEPHPPPSVLRGLLAAQEAELEVRRTGPGPSVSPRLKGSDYMENWIYHTTHIHTQTPNPQLRLQHLHV